MQSVRGCVVLFALVAALGCDEHQYDDTSPVQGTAPPASLEPRVSDTPLSKAERASTAGKLANARCEREQRCQNVGEGRKYANLDKCLSAVTQQWDKELDDYTCPGGTVKGALDKCLAEIRREDCMNPLASLERIVDCDSNEVCRDPNPRP